eukprot:c4352_g1_i1.p1 GENE.c4352_g1_i1~~c4352_g1_i1.p1  ORF type:complete len:248 (+),score=107.09 c4352_g1_i1:42-785(+)
MSFADPFHLVKEEVQQSLGVAKAFHTRWKELKASQSTSQEELDWTRSELLLCLEGIEMDLEAMKQAIQLLEGNHKIQIEQSELQARKTFLAECIKQVQSYKNDAIDPRYIQIKAHKEEHQRLLSAPSSHPTKVEKARMESNNNNQAFIEDQQQIQSQIMKTQDEDLIELGLSVTRIHQIGGAIGQELDNQTIMLNHVDAEIERTDGKLRTIMGKVDVLLKSSDNKKICIIITLILIIIGLFLAVIYL